MEMRENGTEMEVVNVPDSEDEDDDIEFLEEIDNNNDKGFDPDFDVERVEDEEDHTDEYLVVITPEGFEEVVDLFDYVSDPKLDQMMDIFERMALLDKLPSMTPKPPQELNNNENPLEVFRGEEYKFNFENPPRPAPLPQIPDSRELRLGTTEDFLPLDGEEERLSKTAQFKDMCKKVFQRDQRMIRKENL